MITKIPKISKILKLSNTAFYAYPFSTQNKVNYFKIFNLPFNFTEQQLKTSYLSLVKKYHPDLTEDPNAS